VPQNNVGAWPVRVVRPDHFRKDFAYYATKDRAMAAEATVGLMLWDGESHGTLMNVLRLSASGKPAVVYAQPTRTFVDIRRSADLMTFLAALGADSAKRLRAGARAEGLSHQIDQASLQLRWPQTRLSRCGYARGGLGGDTASVRSGQRS